MATDVHTLRVASGAFVPLWLCAIICMGASRLLVSVRMLWSHALLQLPYPPQMHRHLVKSLHVLCTAMLVQPAFTLLFRFLLCMAFVPAAVSLCSLPFINHVPYVQLSEASSQRQLCSTGDA